MGARHTCYHGATLCQLPRQVSKSHNSLYEQHAKFQKRLVWSHLGVMFARSVCQTRRVVWVAEGLVMQSIYQVVTVTETWPIHIFDCMIELSLEGWGNMRSSWSALFIGAILWRDVKVCVRFALVELLILVKVGPHLDQIFRLTQQKLLLRERQV